MDTLAELLAEQRRCANRLNDIDEVARYLEIQEEINKMAALTAVPV